MMLQGILYSILGAECTAYRLDRCLSALLLSLLGLQLFLRVCDYFILLAFILSLTLSLQPIKHTLARLLCSIPRSSMDCLKTGQMSL